MSKNLLRTATSSGKEIIAANKNEKIRNKSYFYSTNNKMWSNMSRYTVKKANNLARAGENMSKASQLWASYLITCLPKPKDDDKTLKFPTLRFTYSEIKEMMNIDGKKRIGKLADVIAMNDELYNTSFEYISEETGKRIKMRWMTSQEWDDGEKDGLDNEFIYKFNPGLHKLLLNLEGSFTLYNYFYRVCLSKKSMKMYELLKSKKYLQERYNKPIELHVEDIKSTLSLEGRYEAYYDFRRRVLDVCQKELEKFTDIKFTYKPKKKEWKKVISLSFDIQDNQPTELPTTIVAYLKNELGLKQKSLPMQGDLFDDANTTVEKYYPTLFQQLVEWGGRKEVITELIEKYGVSILKYQINHLKGKIKGGASIKDHFGWFRKAVENNYKDKQQDKKKNKATRSDKRKKKEDSVKNYETALRGLKNERFKQSKVLADTIITSNPDVLTKAIENLKENSNFLRGKIKDRIPQELYEDKTITGSIIAVIETYYPEQFKTIDEKYNLKVQQLKKKFV